MKTKNHTLWCEKYRPSTLSDYVFHDDSHEKAFTRMVNDQAIPHLCLSGVQGSGKTTIAYILVNELDIDPVDVLIINASDENSVDIMRDKIKSFVSTYAMGDFKVVILDEADYISHNGQAALRNLMDDNDNARFILTCNHENKVTAPIKSRTQHFRFKSPNIDYVTELVATILITEEVKFDLDTLDAYVAIGYPDIRKVINLVQQYTNDKVLNKPISDTSEATDYKFALLDLISNDNWQDARNMVCENVTSGEWEGLFTFLFNNLHKSQKFQNQNKLDEAIVILAEHLVNHSLVAAPEINVAAMFIRFSLI